MSHISSLFRHQRCSIFRLGIVIAVFGLMFYFAMVQGGFVSWFIFYAFLPVMLYIIFLAVYPLRQIEASRVVENGQIFAGDTLQTQLILKKRWPIPFFLVTAREDTEYGEGAISHASSSGLPVWLGRKASFSCSIANMKRGKYTLSSIQLKIEDPFGFYRKKVNLPCSSDILVYPKVQPINFSEGGAGNNTLRFSAQDADLSQFNGVRAYQPSDRLSWLDWKSTAKINQLVTKQYEPEGEPWASVVYISDETCSQNIFERGISYTASLVKTLLQKDYTVQLTCSHKKKTLILHRKNLKELTEAYRILAELTKEDALKNSDFPISIRKKTTAFAVSTDPKIFEQLTTGARSSRQAQTLFYVTDDPKKEGMAHYLSPFFSLYLVAGDDFRQILKAGN